MDAYSERPAKAKISYSHLLCSTLIGFCFTAFLYIIVIPLAYFFLYGSGASSSRIVERPLHHFILEWGALCLLITVLVVIAINAVRSSKIEKARAYVLAAILLTILYLFRLSVGNFLLGLLL